MSSSAPQPPPAPSSSSSEDDPFSTLLNLESSYYTTGYASGLLHGATLGRLEGRVYGLERGFEKYSVLGRISGRAGVWASRIDPATTTTTTTTTSTTSTSTSTSSTTTTTTGGENLLPKITNPRHVKNITSLSEMVRDVPIRNEDEDVDDVDDRIRRGRGKVKLLGMALGEKGLDSADGGEEKSGVMGRDGMEV